ncbi:MDR family MFS transporter [Actinoalloteichus hymeniacidonis]|uniref:Drug resistance transporter, EmrB/QacA subfamily n=1 Tax=Actinoalloteichus hymeniacidonis TaxID=340345 RepID=A0AAC9HS20_9PSEU|nr:MDR family MFS transporter [Actinoalloteichus hymeniacidonis]AOS63425.1 drug resistance transporter, EmrB/QacA subfamily [Actinoalloteichus hymeniacidonis]MBB5908533.1 EmrB/QacA subfamily drug resistance transporter [Actinoalloteichus hymeniacidonis]
MSSTEVAAPSQRTVNAVFLGLSLGVFLAALDGMIMMSALRTVADELGGLTQQAWATTSYLVTMTVSTLLYGKLSDIFGRKRLYLIAICIFTVGSLSCALAQSMYQLALFRCVQGLGAGGLFPLALAVIADMLPHPRRIGYHARLGAIFGVAGVAGPVLGGLFAGAESLLGVDGWRWVFLVNVPVGLAALAVVAVAFTVDSPRIAHRVDWWGATTLVVGIVPLLILAEQGRDWGWSSPTTLSTAGVSLIGLLLFVGVERAMGDEALLAPRLFRRPAFALVNVINFLGGIGMFAGMALIPLYLQIVRGLSASAAGFLLLPQAIAMPVGALLCGPLLARTGRFTGLLAGGLTIMAACFLALGLTESAALWQTTALVTMLGLGTGVYFQVVLTAMQNSVDRTEMGVASSLAGFSRQLGGVVGTAVTISMLFGLGAQRIAAEFHALLGSAEFAAASNADRTDGAAAEFLAGVRSGEVDLDDTSVLTELDPLLAQPVVDGLGGAFAVVFVSVGVVLSLAVLLTLPIRTRSLQSAR